MVMTRLLLDLKRLHKWKLNIWHGDHGWHKHSQKIKIELAEWCKQHRLEFLSDKAKKIETKDEANARNWRYECLAQKAALITASNIQLPCQHVLTGHTASDKAETLLLNLARGSDLAGLSSLKEKRALNKNIELVRPILTFTRNETSQICKDLELPVWIDPSNKNIRLSRNRIRKQVIPVLESLHPGCSLRMASLSERLGNYKKDQQAIGLLAIAAINNKEGLCRKNLAKLPRSARSTLLAAWLEKESAPNLSTTLLDEISVKLESKNPPGCIHLPQGWRINWEKEFVRLESPS